MSCYFHTVSNEQNDSHFICMVTSRCSQKNYKQLYPLLQPNKWIQNYSVDFLQIVKHRS